MKKSILLIAALFCVSISGLMAQISKNVHVTDAGTLSTLLTSEELATVTELTLTGIIDNTDFITMHDNMPALEVINLDLVNVKDNYIPTMAFWSKTKLKSVILPASLKSIGPGVFFNCTGLTSITIPPLVTSIWYDAFNACTGLSHIEVSISNSVYSSQDGVLFNKAQDTLELFPYGRTADYSIPPL